jgi:hypothetical protein
VIKVDFPEPADRAEWQRWREECEAATRELVAAVAEGNPVEIHDRLYRRPSIKKEVYFAKDGPFRGKCAYCECWITGLQHHGDVEHFRPKKGATDLDGQPVFVPDGDGDGEARIEHHGYYWLAYDWRNLLPSCNGCNRSSQVRDSVTGEERLVGKQNRFPVAGKRAWKPDHDLSEEQPLLIHPVDEDPSAHLEVVLETGMMAPRTPRGQACIDVFGLNLRDRLPEERRKVMDTVKLLILELMMSDDPERRRACRERLARIEQGHEGNYTLAARALIDHRRALLER